MARRGAFVISALVRNIIAQLGGGVAALGQPEVYEAHLGDAFRLREALRADAALLRLLAQQPSAAATALSIPTAPPEEAQGPQGWPWCASRPGGAAGGGGGRLPHLPGGHGPGRGGHALRGRRWAAPLLPRQAGSSRLGTCELAFHLTFRLQLGVKSI